MKLIKGKQYYVRISQNTRMPLGNIILENFLFLQ